MKTALLVACLLLTGCAGLQTPNTPSGMSKADFDAMSSQLRGDLAVVVTTAVSGNVPAAVTAGVKAGADTLALKEKSGFEWMDLLDVLTGGLVGFAATRAHRGKPNRAKN